MRIIETEPRPLNLLEISSTGLVAAASSGFGVAGDVEVWEVGSGRFVQTLFEPGGAATSVAFTPDGNCLLKSAGPYGVSIFEVNGWRPRLHHPEFDLRIRNATFALAAVGNPLLVIDRRDSAPGRVSCWWLEHDHDSAPQLLWQHMEHGELRSDTPAISPYGTCAVVSRHGWATGRANLDLLLRDATTGKVRTTIPLDPSSPPWQLAFTADGSKLLARTDSRTVQLFDAVSGGAAGELVHPGRPFVTGIAIHPRGPVACARTNGTVTLWDAEKREQLRTLDWKAGKLVSVAFSPDGALAAAGTEDGKIVVWDVDF